MPEFGNPPPPSKSTVKLFYIEGNLTSDTTPPNLHISLQVISSRSSCYSFQICCFASQYYWKISGRSLVRLSNHKISGIPQISWHKMHTLRVWLLRMNNTQQVTHKYCITVLYCCWTLKHALPLRRDCHVWYRFLLYLCYD